MSTKHPEIGDWMAYLDGESGDATEHLADHLATCGDCSDVLAALGRSSDQFAEAVSTLDPPRAEVEGALASVKANRRVPAAPSSSARRGWWGQPLARAAAVILAFGVLASGLPGSPVRAWLEKQVQPDRTAVRPVVETAEPAGDPGVRVAPVDGRARVNVQGLEETGEVVVRIVDKDMVSVYATEGAAFATDAGRVLVTQAGDQVMVEFPWGVHDGAVVVDGEVIFRKLGDEVETGDGERSPASAEEIRIYP